MVILPLATEAVRQSIGEAQNVVNAMIKDIKKSPPNVPLIKSVNDSWSKLKKNVAGFVQTFIGTSAMSTFVSLSKLAGVINFQFEAVIDDRTCYICEMLHGTIFPSDYPNLEMYTPTLHLFCRCHLFDVGAMSKESDSRLVNQRDFTQFLGKDLQKGETKITKNEVDTIFNKIKEFKDKYTIKPDILKADFDERSLLLWIPLLINKKEQDKNKD